MILFPLAATVVVSPLLRDLGIFTVVSYNRKEVFAGRRGNRVDETLVVERNGDRYVIAFPQWHTRNSRGLENYCPGEQVSVDGTIRDRRILAERSKIRNLLPPHKHDARDAAPAPRPDGRP